MADRGIPEQFGRYLILREIGRGGMGVVYEARHADLDRRVAIKVIAAHLASDESFLRRFRWESRTAASIEHPNVVPIYDAGEQDRELFLAMRFIDGVNLEQRIQGSGPLEAIHACGLINQVAEGLDAVHSAGLVHRDIKPTNILLSGAEGHEHAYITDFGLAKDAAATTAYTQTGVVLGTIDYAAPEQLEGERVDARTDVYALGCVLYFALTGQVPFPKPGLQAKLKSKLADAPPSPSAVKRVPGQLDSVVMRAMAREPAERFQSAGDLGRAAIAAASGSAITEPERVVATGEAAPDAETIALPTRRDDGSTKASPTKRLETRQSSRRSVAMIATLMVIVAAAGLVVLLARGGGDEPSNSASDGTGDARPHGEASRLVSQSRSLYDVRIPATWIDDKNDQQIGGRIESTWKSPQDPYGLILIDAMRPAAAGTPLENAEGVRADTSQTSGYDEVSFAQATVGGRAAARWIFALPGEKKVDYFFDACGTSFAVLGGASPAHFSSLEAVFARVVASLRPRCGTAVQTRQIEGLSSSSPVSTEGIGPVLTGMTVEEAEAAARMSLRPLGGPNGDCQYFRPTRLADVSFLTINGVVARVDVQNPRIRTLSGVRVGDSAGRVRSVYGGNIVETPHEYVEGGLYLTYVPSASSDRTRMIFETDVGGRITLIRAGRLPEVAFVEGCA
jgi:serine/threonine protein kinase